MCWTAKCCRCISLETGCFLIGGISFILSLLFCILTSIMFCLVNMNENHGMLNGTLHRNFGYYYLRDILDINHGTLDVALGIIMCLSIGGILTSILLVHGLKKNRSGFVLSYFVFAVFLVFILILGALLVLIRSLFIWSAVQFIMALIYIHFLVVVHSVYELMQRGKLFDTNGHGILGEEDI